MNLEQLLRGIILEGQIKTQGWALSRGLETMGVLLAYREPRDQLILTASK